MQSTAMCAQIWLGVHMCFNQETGKSGSRNWAENLTEDWMITISEAVLNVSHSSVNIFVQG